MQILKTPSVQNSLNTHGEDPALRDALTAAEKVMDENGVLLRKLI